MKILYMLCTLFFCINVNASTINLEEIVNNLEDTINLDLSLYEGLSNTEGCVYFPLCSTYVDATLDIMTEEINNTDIEIRNSWYTENSVYMSNKVNFTFTYEGEIVKKVFTIEYLEEEKEEDNKLIVEDTIAALPEVIILDKEKINLGKEQEAIESVISNKEVEVLIGSTFGGLGSDLYVVEENKMVYFFVDGVYYDETIITFVYSHMFYIPSTINQNESDLLDYMNLFVDDFESINKFDYLEKSTEKFEMPNISYSNYHIYSDLEAELYYVDTICQNGVGNIYELTEPVLFVFEKEVEIYDGVTVPLYSDSLIKTEELNSEKDEMYNELYEYGAEKKYTNVFKAFKMYAEEVTNKIDVTINMGDENNGKSVLVLYKEDNEIKTVDYVVDEGQIVVEGINVSTLMVLLEEIQEDTEEDLNDDLDENTDEDVEEEKEEETETETEDLEEELEEDSETYTEEQSNSNDYVSEYLDTTEEEDTEEIIEEEDSNEEEVLIEEDDDTIIKINKDSSDEEEKNYNVIIFIVVVGISVAIGGISYSKIKNN